MFLVLYSKEQEVFHIESLMETANIGLDHMAGVKNIESDYVVVGFNKIRKGAEELVDFLINQFEAMDVAMDKNKMNLLISLKQMNSGEVSPF